MRGLTRELPGRTQPDVTALLEKLLLSGRLAPGDRLPAERRLASDYGVSRPVVREALRTLAERRLVEILPGRGAFVCRPSLAHVASPLELFYKRRGASTRNVIEARLMLECEAAKLAAQRADLDDVTGLAERLKALGNGRSVLETIRLDLAFHLAIASASHNPLIETMFASIMRLSVELMLRSATDPEVRGATDPYHVAVYEAIKARDPIAAGEAMNAHLTGARQAFGSDYDESVDVLATRGMRSLGYSTLADFLSDVTSGLLLPES